MFYIYSIYNIYILSLSLSLSHLAHFIIFSVHMHDVTLSLSPHSSCPPLHLDQQSQQRSENGAITIDTDPTAVTKMAKLNHLPSLFHPLLFRTSSSHHLPLISPSHPLSHTNFYLQGRGEDHQKLENQANPAWKFERRYVGPSHPSITSNLSPLHLLIFLFSRGEKRRGLRGHQQLVGLAKKNKSSGEDRTQKVAFSTLRKIRGMLRDSLFSPLSISYLSLSPLYLSISL